MLLTREKDLVFKRREKRSYGQLFLEIVYPRGGWTRSVQYIRHRLKRLPDSPERIARGIFAGVAVTFTPVYGLHFLLAFLIAKVMRGNIFAALMATFFGNPLTYLPIAQVSLRTGYFLTGQDQFDENRHGVLRSFARASDDLWDNFKAIFTHREADWGRLSEFYSEVFYPFLIGGIIPGVITGLIAYYLSVPVIRAYQKRRSAKVRAKLSALRRKARMQADAVRNSD